MKKSSLLLGFGAAASLLITPMLSSGCRTARHAHDDAHSCGCKGEGKCGNKAEGKCGCKMNEGKCGGEGSCGDHKEAKPKQ